jgi:hypothetical protein
MTITWIWYCETCKRYCKHPHVCTPRKRRVSR